VERNVLRANLVKRAEDWSFGSLWIHQHGSVEDRAPLSPWPLPRPRKWLEYVNEPETERELKALRRSAVRGAPYGRPDWVAHTARNPAWDPPSAIPAHQRHDKLVRAPIWSVVRLKNQFENTHLLMFAR
jgi:hypothetical protein